MEVPPHPVLNSGYNSFANAEIAFTALLLRNSRAPVESTCSGEDARNFFRALGIFFQAPQAEIDEVRLLCREAVETPVVFHISRHARVASEEVAREHLAGRPWSTLLVEHHVQPETFHVALGTEKPTSRGRPYRSCGPGACGVWKPQILTDDDVVNLVNVMLASACYGVAPDHVIALRMAGWSYPHIHSALQSATSISGVWEDRDEFGAPADSNRRAVAGAPRG